MIISLYLEVRRGDPQCNHFLSMPGEGVEDDNFLHQLDRAERQSPLLGQTVGQPPYMVQVKVHPVVVCFVATLWTLELTVGGHPNNLVYLLTYTTVCTKIRF